MNMSRNIAALASLLALGFMMTGCELYYPYDRGYHKGEYRKDHDRDYHKDRDKQDYRRDRDHRD